MANPIMTSEQKELFNKLTTLQSEVALNSLSGMNDIDSYKASRGKAKTIKAMEAGVSEILGNPKVKAFVDAMRETTVNNAIMSRDEILERLSDIARTDITDLVKFGYRAVETVDEETGESTTEMQAYVTLKESHEINPDHIKAIEEVSTSKGEFKFKQVSPLAAMKQISDMQGHNAATKFDHLSSDGSMTPTRNLSDAELLAIAND